MSVLILGGGLAGVSLSAFLEEESIVLEAEERTGGLCRSFGFAGSNLDVGPHILFSKDERALSELLAACPTARLRRSNKIFHAGRLVKYPFENELSALPAHERDRCLREFLDNPYRGYDAANMLQFFLKTFGEGITRLYLRPYNEKIWKFDPAFMDTQMVERIPRPPDEDIKKSAAGEATEGYLHQLYFNYPESGGIESVVRGFAVRARGKAAVHAPVALRSITRKTHGWQVDTDKGAFTAQKIVNCMPLHELFKYIPSPDYVREALAALKYNSIRIVALKARKDSLGDNFAVNFADPGIVFHRLSKLNFLGGAYAPAGGSSLLMAEITFRPGSELASWSDAALAARVREDLHGTGLVDKNDIEDAMCKTFKYAYVIYDLSHRANKAQVMSYLAELGIPCCGRFAEFEYLNMDAVIARSLEMARKLKG